MADGQYAEDEVMKDPDMPMEEAELMSPRERFIILTLVLANLIRFVDKFKPN